MATITIVLTIADNPTTRTIGIVSSAGSPDEPVATDVIVRTDRDAIVSGLLPGAYVYEFRADWTGDQNKFQVTADDLAGATRGQTLLLTDRLIHVLRFEVV